MTVSIGDIVRILSKGTRVMQCVMISCEFRDEARSITIPQLEAAGLEPVVFLSPCTPPGPKHNALVSFRALQHAQREDEHVLFVEDDVDVNAGALQDALQMAVEANCIVYMYHHDKPKTMSEFYGSFVSGEVLAGEALSDIDLKPMLYQIHNIEAANGSQCIFIPRDVLRCFELRSLHPEGQRWLGTAAFDVWLPRMIDRMGLEARVALPHPVQHRQDLTGRAGKFDKLKRSKSFQHAVH